MRDMSVDFIFSTFPFALDFAFILADPLNAGLVGRLDRPCALNRLLHTRLFEVPDRTGARESQANQIRRTAIATIM